MRTQKCRKCPKQIVFLKTTAERWEPVNPESLSEADKHELERGLKVVFDPKRHISHFATCPAAAEFRKKKAESKPKIDKAPMIYE